MKPKANLKKKSIKMDKSLKTDKDKERRHNS